MFLHYTKIKARNQVQTTLIFLHGIMGKGRNWQRFATDLLKQKPNIEAVLVDLRLHGESQDLPPPHTVQACGQDVVSLIESEKHDGCKTILVGHSFGGKVALEVARQSPHLMDEIWLIDSFPGLSVKQGDAWRMIEWLKAHQGPFDSRTEVIHQLKESHFSESISAWMATNLETEGKKLKWIFSVMDIAAMLEDYARYDLTDVLLNPPRPIHLVKGTLSPLITDELIQKIKNTAAQFTIQIHEVKAGHWVHSENPKDLMSTMMNFL